jgi:hypothetical protein
MLIPDTQIEEGHAWKSGDQRLLCLGTFIPDPTCRVLVVYRQEGEALRAKSIQLYDIESGAVAHMYPTVSMQRHGWHQHTDVSAVEAGIRAFGAWSPVLKCVTRTPYLDALLGCTSAAWRKWTAMEAPPAPATRAEWEIMLEQGQARARPPVKPKAKQRPPPSKEGAEYRTICIGPGVMRVRVGAGGDASLLSSMSTLSRSARRSSS